MPRTPRKASPMPNDDNDNDDATTTTSSTALTPTPVPMTLTGKRTERARQAILAAFRLGASLRVAAATGGYSQNGLRKWRDEDPTLAMEIEQAQAEFVNENLAAIAEAGKKSWQARAWLLERTLPDEFGRTVQQSQVDVKVQGQVLQRIEIVEIDDWRGKKQQRIVDSEVSDGDADPPEQQPAV